MLNYLTLFFTILNFTKINQKQNFIKKLHSFFTKKPLIKPELSPIKEIESSISLPLNRKGYSKSFHCKSVFLQESESSSELNDENPFKIVNLRNDKNFNLKSKKYLSGSFDFKLVNKCNEESKNNEDILLNIFDGRYQNFDDDLYLEMDDLKI